MITLHEHSIVGAITYRDKWRYEQKRNSEIERTWWQAPLTITNLVEFLKDPNVSDDDRVEAYEKFSHVASMWPIVRNALQWKASTERIEEGELHCDVVDKPDFMAALLGQASTRPLEYLREYCDYYKPYSQQLIGADFILKMKRCGILYDMRVGKTLTAIIAMKYLLNAGTIAHGVVVCPRILTESVWAIELRRQGLDVYVLENGPSIDEATIAHQTADVYIMSYETLVNRLQHMNSYLPMDRLMVVCDESSRIKNPRAKRTKAVHALTYHTPYVVMLTGTPMEQGPQDIWAQMFPIDRGARLHSTFDAFAGAYTEQVGAKYFVRKEMKMRLEFAIQASSLRYVRSEADQFAGKDKHFRWIELAPSDEQAYATEMAIRGFVHTLSGSYHEILPHILTLYGFLREICCGYNKVRLDELSPYSRFRFEYDAKTLWLETWLESNPGEPAVIYSEFDEHEQIVVDMLERINVEHVWLKRDNKTLGPAECIRRFQEGEVRVIMMKTSQAEGITLNRIHAVKNHVGTFPSIIYMAPTWSLGRFQQSQDRCIGTYEGKNIVTPIYCLVTKGSIEEKIMEAIRSKKNVQETLLKDAERQGYESFLDELKLEPSDAAGDGSFDAREMHSRRIIGLSPEKKPTHQAIERLCPEVRQVTGQESWLVGADPTNYTPIVRKINAALYLMDKYDEIGTLMKPNERVDPDYGQDIDFDINMEQS
jgi:hypothetical protein